MTTDSTNPRAHFRRALLGGAFSLVASALSDPALARTPTIRITPNNLAFPIGTCADVNPDPNITTLQCTAPAVAVGSACANNVACGATSVEIFVDFVPADGLKGFNIRLIFDPSRLSLVNSANTNDPNNRVLDPNLLIVWGGSGNVQTNNLTIENGDTLHWEVRSSTSGGPTGSDVRLGEIRLGGVSSGNGTLSWEQGSACTDGTCIATLTPFFDEFVDGSNGGATFSVGTPSGDLIIACTQTSPSDPNSFVDGDTLTLDCTATNAGTAATSGSTDVLAVFTPDLVIQSSDPVAIEAGGIVPSLQPGATHTFTMTSMPNPGSLSGGFNLCIKVDATSNQPAGKILETDESNNQVCNMVEVKFPVRDLVIDVDPNDPNIALFNATPSQVDPNAFHAGLLLKVDYTVKNAGIAIVRTHRNVVRLIDNDINTLDPIICELMEPDSPGILGGDSIVRSYGDDGGLPLNSMQRCALPFDLSPVPEDYTLAVQLDANFQVSEQDPNGVSLEGNNITSRLIRIESPVPPKIRAADPNAIGNLNQGIEALNADPNSHDAFFSLIAAKDLASFAFTVTWAPACLMEIADPNDVIINLGLLGTTGRTVSCAAPAINNNAGTLTVSCSTTGAQPGVTFEGSQSLTRVVFNSLVSGNGTFTFLGVSATDSTGMPIINLESNDGTFAVTGPSVMDFQNMGASPEAFPGIPFSVNYDLCNLGYGPSPPALTTDVYISRDPNININADHFACDFGEAAAIAAPDCVNPSCVSRTIDTCQVDLDLRPGVYSAGFRIDPAPVETTTLPFPSRLFALRQQGARRMIESTRAPDPNAAVGAPLGSDRRLAARSITTLKSASQNRNFIAGWIKPPETVQRVFLFRTPKSIDEDLFVVSKLRLPRSAIAVMGGADIDADGEDELILLNKSRDGQFLDFRKVNYVKRRPEVGVRIAVTAPFPETIVGATGIRWDGDAEDEVAIVTDDGSAQTVTIYDLVITQPPDPSPLLPLTDEPAFGAPGDLVESICVLDADLDDSTANDLLVTLNVDSSGVQSLKVFDPPAVPGGPFTLVATEPDFGGTASKPRVLAIACTR